MSPANAVIIVFICMKMPQKTAMSQPPLFYEGKYLENGNVFMHQFAVCGLFFNWNTALERYFQVLSNVRLQ